MKTKLLIAAAALTFLTAPALASTPTGGSVTRSPNDQATLPTPDQYMGNDNAYTAPFADHLRQNRTDDLRPKDGGSRNNLMPPGMDASGVPDPRI